MNRPAIRIIEGDCRQVLDALPDQSVHCVVTSPPYWCLRDYGVPGQLGLEPTPEEYIDKMVAIFAQVRRVLRDDGTVWLNMGDSYAAGGQNSGSSPEQLTAKQRSNAGCRYTARKAPPGLKPKDLVGIPWRLALALQADGWWLRSDIIWHKSNPMPESVRDRPTKSHEYVFLLAKSKKYFYDSEAVKEPTVDGKGKRNRRTVWTMANKPFRGAHFAVFPPALAEPCIKAGTSGRGCCPTCGQQHERITRKKHPKTRKVIARTPSGQTKQGAFSKEWFDDPVVVDTLGWQPSCTCSPVDPIPCTVLDPFGGAGTAGLVAGRLGRSCILIELSKKYVEMCHDRIKDGNVSVLVEVVKNAT